MDIMARSIEKVVLLHALDRRYVVAAAGSDRGFGLYTRVLEQQTSSGRQAMSGRRTACECV